MLRSIAIVLCCVLAGPLFAQKARIDSLNNVLSATNVDTIKRDIHLQLVDIYERNRLDDKAFLHLQEYKSLNKQISERKNEAEILAAEAKYTSQEKALQTEVVAKEKTYQEQVNYLIENEKSVSSDQSTLIMMLSAVGLILIVSLVIVVRASSKRNVAKKALADTRADNAKLREDAINAGLASKSEQITTRMGNIIRKKESLEALKEKMLHVNTELDGKQQEQAEKLLEAIEGHVDIETEWEEFYRYFEDVNSDFFTNVKKRFPELSESQFRLCALVRLKLDIDAAAAILRMDPNSVRVARTRLRQKVNLPPDMNLEDLMMEI